MLRMLCKFAGVALVAGCFWAGAVGSVSADEKKCSTSGGDSQCHGLVAGVAQCSVTGTTMRNNGTCEFQSGNSGPCICKCNVTSCH